MKIQSSPLINIGKPRVVTIDIDAAGDDRSKIYDYIINRFGKEKTAFILAIGTDSSKGTIDDIGRGLSIRWCNKNRAS